ncbi:uncharacterized protein LOC111324954 [Stylophora pistillata]|uniref:uncharacterized protein LOC111324954 n=1 Tax=Stylophora pistillata TaxID=50429 RepID=UPI000C04A9FA|nr:uncharacterized protein LOC111324954 [Stylophora pistillata]
MTWLPIFVLSGLDIVALFFNVRMLIICFKDESKYTFLENCRALAICQGACQVTILISDSVEWWNGFTILPGETCRFFRVLSLSVMFYQTCNLTAMMTVYNEHPAGQKTEEASCNARMYAALSLGVVGSAMILWHNCFTQGLIPLNCSQNRLRCDCGVCDLPPCGQLSSKTLKTTHRSYRPPPTRCASPLKVHKGSRRPLFFTVLFATRSGFHA